MLQGDIELGEGVRLWGSNYLQGPLKIGAHTAVYPHACVGLPPQDLKTDPADPGFGTVIGQHNVIREGVTIHRGVRSRPTQCGDHNYLMVNSHMGHDVVIGSRCMFANGVLLGGHVDVGDAVVIGGNGAVHQFCRMGRMSMLSGGAISVGDVPPFMMSRSSRHVDCLNVVGLRRAGLRNHLKPLRRAFDLLYREQHTNTQAVSRIRAELADDPLCVELADFVDTTQKGITPLSPDAR